MRKSKSFQYNILLLLISLIAPFLFTACDKDPGDCLMSTGEIITVTRELDNFDAVILFDNIDVEFVKANTPEDVKIEITCGANLIDNIISSLEVHTQYFPGIVQTDPETGDTINIQPGVNKEYSRLKIANENQCNLMRDYTIPIKAVVYFHEIRHMEYRSNGKVTFADPIITDRFMINIFEGSNSINLKLNANKSYLNFHYGTADLTVTGSSEICYIYQASFGPVDARDFTTDFTYLENRSPNHCFVDARLQLGATINNTGNVYYKTEPENISLSGTGTGKLLKLEP